MPFGNIVDKLHNEYGLTHTGTTEQTDFATLAVGFQKVDNLDTCKQDFSTDSKVFELGCRLVDGTEILPVKRGKVVDGIADYIEQASFHLVAGRHCNRTVEVVDTQTAAQAVGTLHGHAAHGILADMLLHFKNQHRTVLTVNLKRRIDRGKDVVVTFEDNVHYRADYLRYFSEFIAHCESLLLCVYNLFQFPAKSECPEIPSLPDDNHHQYKVHQVNRQQVFPFECEQLVDTQTGISPLEPYNHE